MASSLELNKLAAGVLTAGIIAFGAAVFSGLLYHPRPLQENAFPIDVGDEEVDVAEAEVAEEESSIAVLLASADPAAGETITRQCAACHVFDEGGANRVGPALWDVVGREIGSVSDFGYSAAFGELEGEWTFEKLDAYLTNPREYAPGTSMAYAGLRDPQDRANLIAYLRERSNDPVPLPQADAETADAEPAAAQPAEELVEDAEPAETEVAATEEPVEEAEPAEEVAAAPIEEAVADAAAVVEEAEEAVEAAVSEAAEETVETAEAAVAAVDEVAEEVADDLTEAAETATAEVADEATEAVDAAAETVAALAEETADVASEAVEETAEAPAAEEVEVAEAPTNGAELSGMVALVAAADPADGQRAFRQCAACHTVDQGGQNRVGPNLWGVFGADIGHHEGFNYSNALLGLEGIWTVDKLNAYLENPRGYAAGNRMAFAGLRNEDDRAAVIAYLRSLSEDPKPVDLE